MVKRSDLNKILLESLKSYDVSLESAQSNIDKKYDIFLCHSSKDIDEIRKLKEYLRRNANKEAYVCEIDDPQLDPSKANKTTAKILKQRMENSSELYFVLSKNSQKSTWMPWELGYFNGKKSDSKIYVYPIIDNDESEIWRFEGNEYLELYPKNDLPNLSKNKRR